MVEFEAFREKLLKDYQDDVVVENPHYYMNIGSFCLSYMTSFVGRNMPVFYRSYAALAVDMYTRALEKDEQTTFVGYYYRAYTRLRLDGMEHKRMAKKDLQRFIKFAELKLEKLRILCANVQNNLCEEQNSDDELTSHIEFQIKLYETMVSSAKQNIEEIKQSQKLADIKIQLNQSEKHVAELDKDDAKEVIAGDDEAKFTLGFRDVRNAKDWGSNKAASLFDSVEEKHAKFGLRYSSDHLGNPNHSKQILLNLLPINSWGRYEEEVKVGSVEKNEKEKKAEGEETSTGGPVGFTAHCKRGSQIVGKKKKPLQ